MFWLWGLLDMMAVWTQIIVWCFATIQMVDKRGACKKMAADEFRALCNVFKRVKFHTNSKPAEPRREPYATSWAYWESGLKHCLQAVAKAQKYRMRVAASVAEALSMQDAGRGCGRTCRSSFSVGLS